MKNKLEQVFWRKGKFVTSKNKEVDPKEIGETRVSGLNYPFRYEEILKKLEENSSNFHISDISQINAYMIGNGVETCYSFISEPRLLYVSLGFYKI
jgi:hypothetical protein